MAKLDKEQRLSLWANYEKQKFEDMGLSINMLKEDAEKMEKHVEQIKQINKIKRKKRVVRIPFYKMKDDTTSMAKETGRRSSAISSMKQNFLALDLDEISDCSQEK